MWVLQSREPLLLLPRCWEGGGRPEAHLACGGCFKYFGKSLRQCEVAVLHRDSKSGFQALDRHCKGHNRIFFRMQPQV